MACPAPVPGTRSAVGGRMRRVGIIGTGYIARGLARVLAGRSDLGVSHMLTRGDPAARRDLPSPLVTRSLDELLDHADVVVECSGDAIHATGCIDSALRAGLPVVTMDAEFHVTSGSHFVGRGELTEAEGDQPGSLAALREHALEMGFRPLIYGNFKGFLDPTPSRAAMEHWSAKLGISLEAVTSFTDGTKVQIEQVLVANGLGAELAEPGRLGVRAESLAEATASLAEHAARLGRPLSEFVFLPDSPAGVFLVGDHEEQAALRYLKQGPGPYTLVRDHHLIHLEIPRTIRRLLDGGGVLLAHSARPRYGVAAVAKRALRTGEVIARGVGGFDVRGSAVRLAEAPAHVPIGLLRDAVLLRPVDPGETLRVEHVELPDSLAVRLWRERLAASLSATSSPAS